MDADVVLLEACRDNVTHLCLKVSWCETRLELLRAAFSGRKQLHVIDFERRFSQMARSLLETNLDLLTLTVGDHELPVTDDHVVLLLARNRSMALRVSGHGLWANALSLFKKPTEKNLSIVYTMLRTSVATIGRLVPNKSRRDLNKRLRNA